MGQTLCIGRIGIPIAYYANIFHWQSTFSLLISSNGPFWECLELNSNWLFVTVLSSIAVTEGPIVQGCPNRKNSVSRTVPILKSIPVRKVWGGSDFFSVNRGPVRWYGFLVLIIRTGTDFKNGTVRGTEFSTENWKNPYRTVYGPKIFGP